MRNPKAPRNTTDTGIFPTPILMPDLARKRVAGVGVPGFRLRVYGFGLRGSEALASRQSTGTASDFCSCHRGLGRGRCAQRRVLESRVWTRVKGVSVVVPEGWLSTEPFGRAFRFSSFRIDLRGSYPDFFHPSRKVTLWQSAPSK